MRVALCSPSAAARAWAAAGRVRCSSSLSALTWAASTSSSAAESSPDVEDVPPMNSGPGAPTRFWPLEQPGTLPAAAARRSPRLDSSSSPSVDTSPLSWPPPRALESLRIDDFLFLLRRAVLAFPAGSITDSFESLKNIAPPYVVAILRYKLEQYRIGGNTRADFMRDLHVVLADSVSEAVACCGRGVRLPPYVLRELMSVRKNHAPADAVEAHWMLAERESVLNPELRKELALANLRALAYFAVATPSYQAACITFILSSEPTLSELALALQYLVYFPPSAQRDEQARRVLSSLPLVLATSGSTAPESFWDAAFTPGAFLESDPTFAFAALEALSRAGGAPAERHLYAAMRGAAARGDAEQAELYLQALQGDGEGSGLEWSKFNTTYLSALKADPLSAYAYFDRAPHPDEHDHVAFLSVIARSPTVSASTIQTLLSQLPEPSTPALARSTLIGYTSAIWSLARRGEPEAALALWDRLPSEVELDSLAIAPVVRALAALHRWDEAIELLDRHPHADATAPNSLLRALARAGERHGAWWVWSVMETRWGIKRDYRTLAILLDAGWPLWEGLKEGAREGEGVGDGGKQTPSRYFRSEGHSFTSRLGQVGLGFFRDWRGENSGLGDPDLLWRHALHAFEHITLANHPELELILPPIHIRSPDAATLHSLTRPFKSVFGPRPPPPSLTSFSPTNPNPPSPHTHILPHPMAFSAYITLLHARRAEDPERCLSDALRALAWMRDMRLPPDRRDLARCLVAAGEAVAPDFWGAVRRGVTFGGGGGGGEEGKRERKEPEMEVLEEWMVDWVGEEGMPDQEELMNVMREDWRKGWGR